MEEDPRNRQPDPDHEAEQADHIDRGEPAEALLPQQLEVRQHSDREEGQDEEDDPEGVGFADCGRDVLGDLGRGAEREIEADDEGHHEADDELRKALPDFPGLRLKKFPAELLQNTRNVLPLPTLLHEVATDEYRKPAPDGSGRTLYRWLQTQPYEVQREIGLNILRKLGILK